LIRFYGDGQINIGPSSYIGELSSLQATVGYSINIGKGCKVSHNVRIYTESGLPDYDLSIDNLPQKYGDVNIRDFCWIGANVFINPKVTIGENSVVGANSVVTKDIPPFEIWGGVPAKLIRKKRDA
jgi:maltose O-acetyltransferase